MKTCKICQETKPSAAFRRWLRTCRKCERTGRKSKEARAAERRRRIDRVRAIANKAKNKPCADCKQRFPAVVMDFDHVSMRPKVANISEIVARGGPVQQLRIEISKCEVVCSNCHRMRTYARHHAAGLLD